MSDERLTALLNDLVSDDEETLSQVLAAQVQCAFPSVARDACHRGRRLSGEPAT